MALGRELDAAGHQPGNSRDRVAEHRKPGHQEDDERDNEEAQVGESNGR
jgi:hypothetical protein